MPKCEKCGKEIGLFDSYQSNASLSPEKRICKTCAEGKQDQQKPFTFSIPKKVPTIIAIALILLILTIISDIGNIILLVFIGNLFAIMTTQIILTSIFLGIFEVILITTIIIYVLRGVTWSWAALFIFLVLGLGSSIIYIGISLFSGEALSKIGSGYFIGIIIRLFVLSLMMSKSVRIFFELDRTGSVKAIMKHKMTIVFLLLTICYTVIFIWIISSLKLV